MTAHNSSGATSDRWNDLLTRMHELKDLDGVVGLMEWEDETYAPSGSRRARGPQVATLEAIRHRKLTDPVLRELLAEVQAPTPHDATALARLGRRVDRATRVPESLVKALAEARSAALPAWQDARARADFSVFAPHLERVVELTQARADALGGAPSRYAPLLDSYEPEMTVEALEPVLGALERELVPMVKTLAAASPPPHAFLQRRYDDRKQWDFTLRLLGDLGFDFDHGRQDRSTHPFTATVNERDVRVTTRIIEDNLLSSISSTVHECGHALYEQGFDPAHHRTYLAEAPSMGIHESQSRLWENQVGLGRPFWTHYLPLLHHEFPEQLAGVDVDTFWRAANRVAPSFIRVDADEVTYNLHIVVRFTLERALIEGDLKVADLPAAWNDRMVEVLDVKPPDDAQGCLQDIHWAMGAFGYFPTYSLGNLYAAQLYEAFVQAHPSAESEFAEGRFDTLLGWLRTNVHLRGHTASAQAIVADAVGEPLSADAFFRYLRTKYTEIYGVAL